VASSRVRSLVLEFGQQGQEFSIGVRVGSSTYEAVFCIYAKMKMSLYSMAFGYSFKIF